MIIKRVKPFFISVALLAGWQTSAAAAEEDWWFDVEVIIFDRGLSLNEVAERFVESDDFSRKPADWDIIHKTTQPNVSWLLQSLPLCEPEPDWIMVEAQDVYPLPTLPELPPLPAVSDGVAGIALDSNEPLIDTQFDGPPEEPVPEDVTPVIVLDPAQTWLETFAPEILAEPFTAAIPATDCYDDQLLFHDTMSYPNLARLPVVIEGHAKDESWGVHALDAEQHTLTELSKQIRRESKLTRLLHIAWRQPVAFGRDNAKTVRLYGGVNFAQDFDASGMQIQLLDEVGAVADTQPLQDFDWARTMGEGLTPDVILRRLPKPDEQTEIEHLEQLWQIEGSLKVYLQYVNRVPYLHVDNDFLYRQPVAVPGQSRQTMRLANIPFTQLRRVISTQLHYFDHPMFGMLVEIRRFKKP